MALPKGPLLAPIGRNMQEIAVEDIAKEIAAEFQKQVPMDMTHNVNVHVDPIEIDGLEDSGDADRIVEALNAIRNENPDAVEIVNSGPVSVSVAKEDNGDAEKVEGEDGEELSTDLLLLDIKEAVNENTSAIVSALGGASSGSDATKEDEQDDREDAAREKLDETAGEGMLSPTSIVVVCVVVSPELSYAVAVIV